MTQAEAQTVQVPEPGIHRDVSFETYRAWDADNASLYNEVRKSPLHAWWQIHYGSESTPAQELGTAAHMAFLEPERFDATYTVLPEDHDGRTKEGKARKQEIEEQGKTPLKAGDAQMCEAIRQAVHSHVDLRRMVQADGDNELSLVWENGSRLQKARIDRWVPLAGIAIDLKTTTCARPDAFKHAVRKYGYDLAAYHYLEGIEANELPGEEIWLVAVEKSPPHVITIFRFDGKALARGREKRDFAMEQLAACRAMDYWPGYSDTAVTITGDDVADGQEWEEA